MSFLKPATPVTPTLPTPPPPVMSPQGTKPGKKSTQATFLGADDIANPATAFGQASGTSQGGKTLLGT